MMEDTVTISQAEYDQLKAQSAALAELEALVEQLRTEIAFLKNGRSSKTSSTPSSQDIARSNTVNLRVKSGKKSGGQSLEAVQGEIATRRQEVEIPVVQPLYIEHQSFVKRCPCCGLKNKGAFPPT
jgi:hypothetical protein